MSRERELLELITPRIARLAGQLGVATMEAGDGYIFSIGTVTESFSFSNLEADFDTNRFDKISQEAGVVISRVLRRSSEDSKDFEHGYHSEEEIQNEPTTIHD